MLYVHPKHNWFEFYAGFLLLKVASALCSHAEARREPVGGGGGSREDCFFTPQHPLLLLLGMVLIHLKGNFTRFSSRRKAAQTGHRLFSRTAGAGVEK